MLGGLKGTIESVVMQYMDAVHAITDDEDHLRMERTMQILHESPEYFGAALEIEKVIKTAKLHLIRLLFDDFKEEMKSVEETYGLELETETAYYSYESKMHDKFYDGSGTTFPGLNYVVKRARFSEQSLQMWFRIEIDHQLFAGIALYDTAASESGDKGAQVDEITEGLMEESARYVDKDIISPVNWWLTWCYPNGKHQEGSYEDVPDFKAMNSCAIELVDAQKRKEYVKTAIGVFEEHLLRYLR